MSRPETPPSAAPLPSPDELAARIEDCVASDRPAFARRLASIRRAIADGKPHDRNLGRLDRDTRRSAQVRQRRADAVPAVTYDDTLPVVARRDEIAAAIRDHQVVVVAGETGSGKSTQLPKICLDLGRGVDGLIGHTQPRRIAARSVAARVAEELKVPVGKQVGFQVRFTDATVPETLVKLMTDGILLAEIQGDRLLSKYDTLIIDEAHERSLNIDLLLGVLNQILPRRPDFRLVITSATIDSERFADFFKTADTEVPVIEVSGRTYPVEVRYRPLAADADDKGRSGDLYDGLADAVAEVCREGPGDVLCFLPTERQIRDAAEVLRGRSFPGQMSGSPVEILPLYGRLSAAEQQKVFAKHPGRRVTLATNVAESSLTVPDVRYVVDAGTARVSRFSTRTGVQRLPIEPVSQASADQRKGRCGRVGPGICVRLFSEEDYVGREEYTPPEVLRTNLASVILRLASLGLGRAEDFPFLDPPRPAAIRSGIATLTELGALDDAGDLTDLGRTLGRMPVDPRIGRMLIAGHEERCLAEVLVIAAALEVQDPRDRPIDKQQAADEKHRRFVCPDSDFLAYLEIWEFYRKLTHDLSRSKLKIACRENFLSYNRLREWSEVHRQLQQFTTQAGYKSGKMKPSDDRGRDGDAIHRALLTGLLSRVALKNEKEAKSKADQQKSREYQSAAGTTVTLWPGSGLSKKPPKWLVSAELVETSRRFARTCARINPAWIEPLAGNLVKKSHGDPTWDAERGTVWVDERVSLYGLPVVPRRRVRCGPIDPVRARELFVQHGLVEEELPTDLPFFRDNGELRAAAEREATKARRLDRLRGEADRFAFYDARLPDDVYDLQSLEAWHRRASAEERARLRMTRADLVVDEDDRVDDAAFPDHLTVDGVRLPLEYHVDPGGTRDGVTLVVPEPLLPRVPADRLGWLVPGLLTEKVAALARALPKPLRTRLVPIPEAAAEAAAGLRFGHGRVETAVAAALSRIAGEPIRVDDFDAARVPAYFTIQIRVVDERGDTLASGRDVAAVTRELSNRSGGAKPQTETDAATEWHRTGLTRWDWGELPPTVSLTHGDFTVTRYPVIRDRGDGVDLDLEDDPRAAAAALRGGLVRLFALAERRRIASQVDHMPQIDRITLTLGASGGVGRVRPQLADVLAARAFWDGVTDIPRSEEAFEKRRQTARGRLGVVASDLAELLPPLAESLAAARKAVRKTHPKPWAASIADADRQLTRLTAGDWLGGTPWQRLLHLPRYLRAIERRVAKLAAGGHVRDQKLLRELDRFERLLPAPASPLTGPTATLRWQLEEYRVSVFAQDLGTAEKVSLKRLEETAAKCVAR